jgi:hypothetical protein
MDDPLDQEAPQIQQSPATRRFAALTREQDAIYPMLAPAAALTAGDEEDVFDDQILAGLVNI